MPEVGDLYALEFDRSAESVLDLFRIDKLETVIRTNIELMAEHQTNPRVLIGVFDSEEKAHDYLRTFVRRWLELTIKRIDCRALAQASEPPF